MELCLDYAIELLLLNIFLSKNVLPCLDFDEYFIKNFPFSLSYPTITFSNKWASKKDTSSGKNNILSKIVYIWSSLSVLSRLVEIALFSSIKSSPYNRELGFLIYIFKLSESEFLDAECLIASKDVRFFS